MKTLVLSLLASLAIASPAASQSKYPDKQLHVIMPGSPGGSYDLMNRLVMKELGDKLGTPVVIENVTGAAGMLAMERGARSAPNGHNLVVGFVGALAANPWLYKALKYDPVKDFQPILLYGFAPCVAVVPANSPITSFADLVETARKQPGKLNFASAGSGTCGHISGELLKMEGKLDMVHVPYQSAAPATVALLGNQVDFSFEALPASIANIRAGKFRALVVTSSSRSAVLPDVPTVAEAGFPGVEVKGWTGLMAPAKTPPEAIAWLNRELNEILKLPKVRKEYTSRGIEVGGGTPEEFAMLIQSEIETYGKVVKASGIKAE